MSERLSSIPGRGGHSSAFRAQDRAEAIRHVIERKKAEADRRQQEERQRAMVLLKKRRVPARIVGILAEAADTHGVALLALIGPGRKPAAVAARDATIYALRRDNPQLSMPVIGRWFDRDHTSICACVARHAVRSGLPALTRMDIVKKRADAATWYERARGRD